MAEYTSMVKYASLEAYRVIARTFRGTEASAAIIGLINIVISEREARHKLEAALTAKDKAMGVLFERLSAAGVDYSDLIS